MGLEEIALRLGFQLAIKPAWPVQEGSCAG